MPGSNARAIEKARGLPADAIILDLEDSVAPDGKAAAREQVADAVAPAVSARGKSSFASTAWIRPGGSTTRRRGQGQARRDPGAESFQREPPGELRRAPRRHQRRPQDSVWAMMETPLAMLNVREIAAAAPDVETRLAVFVMGTNDLAKETRTRIMPGRGPMLPWLMTAWRRRALLASTSWTASTTICAMPTASRANAARPAIWVSTARP